MRHLDLFSGIGGFALAARWCGMETIAFSEVDKYAIKVLEKNFPGVPNLGDITKNETWPDLGTVNLLTGGFPCQPFSCAGKRRGSEDDRHLWPAMCTVVQRYRPTWVLGENVPGIIPMELDNVLSDLEDLGYTCQTFVIPACAVDARHRRDRIWVVGFNTHSNGQFSRKESTYSFVSSVWAMPDDARQIHCNDGRTWLPEPAVGRVVDGLPNRVDRLKGLGNAIVPAVAYELMRMIQEVESGRTQAGSV